MGDRDLACQARVGDDQVAVDAAGLTAGTVMEGGEDERRHVLADDTPLVRLHEDLLGQRGDVEALVGRAADEDPVAAEAPVGVRHGGGLLGVLDPRGDWRTALGGIEERQGVDAVPEHRNAKRLEHLGRGRDVEERLDARRGDQRGHARAHAEVGGHVRRDRKAAVDSAEPTRAHEADADGGGCGERPTDGGRADGALHRAGREVARPELAGGWCEALELLGGEADHDTAVEHPDGGGHGARGADGGLAREADLDSCRRGEPMRDERRLECDERTPLLERRLNLVGHANEVLHEAQRSHASAGPSDRRSNLPQGHSRVPDVTLAHKS